MSRGPGEDPEGDRDTEGDDGVALAGGEPPSPRRSSAMYSSAPEIRRTSGRLRRIRITQSARNMRSTIGSAVMVHSKKEMVVRLVLDEPDADEVRRAADRRQEAAHRCAVGDHEHQGGAEAQPARVPLALGLVADQTGQGAHYA